MKTFRDRVAVVTGAASGIGRAMAERFAAEGMKVVLADVEEAALAAVAAQMKATGAAVLAVRTNVAKAADVEALAKKTREAFGGVHVLCNNAGVSVGGPVWEHTVQDWEWILGVNLWGVIHGVRVFVPIMLAQDAEAHIVNTASMAGLVSGPGLGAYNVTKHGVVTLSETLHHELALASRGRVRVSVLCPGWVDTRIAESERNRPADLPAAPPPAAQATMMEMVKGMLAQGLPPARVADIVFAAIRDERFWILTHPEWKSMIRTRMEDILEERPPTYTGLA
jgi:NAD(P)-dependent dehydrogenase (short-subunit alcohol dehydrogenase family)